MMRYGILKTKRTEEERLRRRLHGDAGARFKLGKEPWIDRGGVCQTITTLVTKDIQLIETHDSQDMLDARSGGGGYLQPSASALMVEYNQR